MPVIYHENDGTFILTTERAGPFNGLCMTLPEAHDAARQILERIEGYSDGDRVHLATLHGMAEKIGETPERRRELHAAAEQMSLRWRLGRMVRRYVALKKERAG